MIYAYFIIIFFIGLLNIRPKNKDEYFYISRKLTLPSFVATLITTWYGGILEIGRFSYFNGIVTWLIFGLFYYISAIIFAFYIGPKIHKNNIKTIPEYFKKHYGKTSQKIASLILLLVSSPAPYLMILATLLSHIFQIEFSYAIVIGILFSIFYIYSGGFKAVIRTDKIQFILMYSGFLILFLYLFFSYGGINFLITNVPSKNLTLTGNLPIGYILSWSIISMVTFIDPSIFQRTYSSGDEAILKKGIVISIFFWFIFDILSISIGIYASALIDIKTLNDFNPYLYLADNFLPTFIKNIFLISLLSVVMSTIDSFFLVSSMLVTNNLLENKNESIKQPQLVLILIGIISYIIAINFTFVIDVWYIFGSIAGSSILIPFLLILFRTEIKLKYPLLTLISPVLVSLIWLYANYPLGIDIMYPGILTSLIFCLINERIE